MAQSPPDIIKTPITDLSFSGAFKEWAAIHQWTILEDLLAIHVGELQRKKGFTMHLYMELADFLQKHRLSDLLRQRREY
jgi:hypothetical protein